MEGCAFIAENFIIDVKSHLALIKPNQTLSSRNVAGLNRRTNRWHFNKSID